MRTPIRKAPSRAPVKPDPYLTPSKLRDLTAKLERMKKSQPILAAEVRRLAEMGDFSENAAYQLAKGRLRGLNQRILDLDRQLKEALIIKADPGLITVQIGSRVILSKLGQRREYVILGSNESEPSRGIISYLSPLGAALMGKKAGDEIRMKSGGREYVYELLAVEIA